MHDFLPVAVPAKRHPAPPAFIADPAALRALGGELLQGAAVLRSAASALLPAWAHAAAVLSAQRTGMVLADVRPATGAALEESAAALGEMAETLRLGAARYAAADAAAVPGR